MAVAIWKGLYAKILAASGIEFKSGARIQTYAGDPNGVVTASKGSIVMDSTNGKQWINTDGASAWDTGVGSIGSVTGEPTGFQNPDQWAVSYDPTTRIMTLTPTGSQKVFVRGKEFTFSAPIALAHAAVTGKYFYEIDSTGALVVGGTPFDFASKAMAAIAVYDTTQTPLGFGNRETHGLTMDWATHLEFHEKDGTYLVSGGGLTAATYVVSDPGDATNPALADIAPGVPSTVVADEDLRPTLAVLADGGPYQQMRIDWAALKEMWVENVEAPYYRTGNVPYYNPASGGASLVALANDDYCCYYLLQIPVSDDAGSQKFRNSWVPGQQKYTPTLPNTAARTVARDQALAEDPFGTGVLVLDYFPSVEYVITAKIVVHYNTSFTNNDYRLRIEGYQKILRTRTGNGNGGESITLPAILDSSVAITTGSATGGLDPSFETNQKLVNERYANFGYMGAWATGTAYRVGNIVKMDHKTFRCAVGHTAAASFYTDLMVGNWELLGEGGLAGYLQTTDAVTQTIMSQVVPADVACCVQLKVSSFEAATGDSKVWVLEYRLKNSTFLGVTSLGLVAERAYEDTGAALNVAIADISGSTFRVRVTGQAGKTIVWQAICQHTYF